MNATAVETATSRSSNRLASSHRIPLPRIAHILRLALFGAVALAFLATLLLGLVQKWLWMRQGPNSAHIDLGLIPYWKRAHRDWRFWAGAFFISAVIVMTWYW